MSESSQSPIGRISWVDLTVPDADQIQQFYTQVVGWTARPHDMGDYHDFVIQAPESGETVAGICYARAGNANIPPVWLVYITVEDVDHGAQRCLQLGGQILDGPRMMGSQRFCLIQDPAGAIAALISP